MSLLIKALDKAQAEKAQAKGNADLSLSPPKENLTESTQPDELPLALKGSAADTSLKAGLQAPPIKSESPKETTKASSEIKRAPNQAQAANVFTAKRIEATNQNAKVALIFGLIALFVLAALIYWYQTVINVPDVVIPPRPMASMEMPEPMPEVVTDNENSLAGSELAEQSVDAVVLDEEKKNEASGSKAVEPALKQQRTESVLAPHKIVPSTKTTLTANEEVVTEVNNVKSRSSSETFNVGIASESASIEVTKAKTESGVNPILMRAYEAYTAGNDTQAQKDYKQVLERYGPNVDAMLGMGAISVRQGRLADANGWFLKVLEIEPRNDIAKAALISIRQSPQAQGNESNIKSMLATAPEDANLHAALGDLYASRAQWSLAQQAYFDAYRYNPSAENAFNLGVSLDQLGKPKLALPYYQEALQKINQSNVIDKAALEARISSIQ